ncbi:MAG: Por secretion system protein, partial [Muribaculaceae bacterium]|nr:Por secretion system protein [Muribaculaceae bacterium]
MKLSAITFIAALALASSGQAASWTIGNTKYDVDTLSHITAGPGTTETELILLNNDGGTTRLNVFYTETSLQNPNV